MRGLYINLDRSHDRRKHMESEFRDFRLVGVYERLRAVYDRNGAIGCFRSHLKALDNASRHEGLTHILEDDVLLSDALRQFIQSDRPAELMQHYDMLFLDMWVDPKPDIVSRLEAARGSVLDLSGSRIGTGSSYIVSQDSARKIFKLLRNSEPPIDNRYNDLTARGLINAAAVVPFLTGIDLALGSHSMVQSISADEMQRYIKLRTAFFVDSGRQKHFALRIN